MQKEHKPATKGQVLELIARIATQTPWEQVESAFLQKEWVGLSPAAFAEKVLQVFSAPVLEKPEESSIIFIDRATRPTYPDWADSEWINDPKFIALESTGPSEFDVRSLVPWIHEKQKNGVVAGKVVYNHLESNNMLPWCIGLHDLKEIQKKGIAFYRQHFNGKVVFGMKSSVRDAGGHLCAPCLVEDAGEVVLHWHWLDYDFGSSCAAPRFAS